MRGRAGKAGILGHAQIEEKEHLECWGGSLGPVSRPLAMACAFSHQVEVSATGSTELYAFYGRGAERRGYEVRGEEERGGRKWKMERARRAKRDRRGRRGAGKARKARGRRREEEGYPGLGCAQPTTWGAYSLYSPIEEAACHAVVSGLARRKRETECTRDTDQRSVSKFLLLPLSLPESGGTRPEAASY